MTYYMEKSNKGEIPIIFPHSKLSAKEYVNFSEKNRYEKLADQLMKLKQYIINDEMNEKYYIKEFMMKHGIYDEELYTIDKLTNFSNYLFSDMDIDTSLTFKDIIVKACNYDPDNIEGKKEIKIRPFYPKPSRKKSLMSDDKDYSVNFKDLNNTILDKRIKSDMSNPKALINALENELCDLKTEREQSSHKKASNKILELDFGASYQKKKEKIDRVKKKNKLLEYIVLERSKKQFS
jgi:hypothetical protein